MTPLINTFLAGSLYSLAGIFGLVRHFMLEPNSPHDAHAPTWLMRIVFGFSTVLIYVGLRFLTSWATGAAITTPPAATGLGVLLALALFIYTGSLLYDTMTRKPNFTLDELIERFRNL